MNSCYMYHGENQGDRKGSPLLYHDACLTRGACIVGAIPCGIASD